MKTKILLLLFIATILGSCKQNSTSADHKSENQYMETTMVSSIESDIQFILDKYNLISQATNLPIR